RAGAGGAAGGPGAAGRGPAAGKADVVFPMGGFPADVRACLLDPGGALAAARPGQIFVDMSTSSPALAREIDAAARARQAHAVDAPGSRRDVGARDAPLSTMIAGAAAGLYARK